MAVRSEHRRVRRALNAERAQRPTVFVAHALTSYGADAGPAVRRDGFSALASELRALLPLPVDDEQSLAHCRVVLRAEHEPVDLPSDLLSGLVLASRSGQAVDEATRRTHRDFALRFFACQALRQALALLLTETENGALLSSFAPPTQHSVEAITVGLAAWGFWADEVSDIAPIADGARRASTDG